MVCGLGNTMKKWEVILDKIYRKLHYIFWEKWKPGKWALYFYPAYRHYRFHGRGKGKKGREGLYLTQKPNKGAGIGHQMGNWNSGYYNAGRFHVSYAYSPFSSPDWDAFLGFGEGEATARDLIRKKGYKRRMLPYFDEKNPKDLELIQNMIDSYEGERVVFYLELDQYYAAQYQVAPVLKRKFEAAPARTADHLEYEPGILNIALHIRRGDIVEGQATGAEGLTKRWLTMEYYVKIVKTLLSALAKEREYRIYVFSQGKEADFPELEGIQGLRFCLDMPPRQSFLHMARADILITSKSSFSYKPALLCDGLRICPANFWHGYPDSEKWALADDEGNLSPEQLKKLKEFAVAPDAGDKRR